MREFDYPKPPAPEKPFRQIVSREGIPVWITDNKGAAIYSDKILLGIGEPVRLGEMSEPILQEEVRIQKEIDALKDALTEDALARVRETSPEATLSYRDYPARESMMEKILAENPERAEKIQELEVQKKAVSAKRYQFGDALKKDLYVGTEGALIYSMKSGEAVANELKKAKVLRTDENGHRRVDPIKDVRIAELCERIQNAQVADIHQVEILPEFQGKGGAKSLIDVALWDIEQTHGDAEFSVARVIGDNPDQEKMISVFKKAGFEAFFVHEIHWDDPRSYTLVIRENPHVKRVG